MDYILENNHLLKMIVVVHSLRECIQDRDYIEFKETVETATIRPILVLKSIKDSNYLSAIYSKCCEHQLEQMAFYQ